LKSLDLVSKPISVHQDDAGEFIEGDFNIVSNPQTSSHGVAGHCRLQQSGVELEMKVVSTLNLSSGLYTLEDSYGMGDKIGQHEQVCQRTNSETEPRCMISGLSLPRLELH
jgi:hypothetical protein